MKATIEFTDSGRVYCVEARKLVGPGEPEEESRKIIVPGEFIPVNIRVSYKLYCELVKLTIRFLKANRIERERLLIEVAKESNNEKLALLKVL